MKTDMADTPRIYLSDYQAPDFKLLHTELVIHLWPDYAEVESVLAFERSADAAADAPLVLLGADLELLSASWNDRLLSTDDYCWQGEVWRLATSDQAGQLTTRVRIYPDSNKALEGLYRSHGMYCTQCEAEGFRKITLYPDRPDVLSTFRTTIHADRSRYPVLLANGNRVASGETDDGRHWATWVDPFPKPSYLFAMVAGDLACYRDSFTTQSGRVVALEIFTTAADQDKCAHAMDSLKAAMHWDEQRYGCEYDLDVYMIVAVSHFNMGAMENKGLNIFNTSCVLAHPSTTTDAGFQRVESVVAHEYFHNWSGNRVTCRDWFQLCLKEGFTVFRDQQFSADQLSAAVQRLEDVAFLKTHQFAEDAGPLSHPVRPSAFVEINNFYTLTVYEKGAEIARMLHTWLGEPAFRRGSDRYFAQYDGQAVTVEHFLMAMAEANALPVSEFVNTWLRWYTQSGTPVVHVTMQYDGATQSVILTLTQTQPAQEPAAQPLPMPVRIGFVGEAGDLFSEFNGQQATEHTLRFTKAQQSWRFTGLKELPVLSIFRDFSAPVRVVYDYSGQDLQRLVRVDSNGFNRWNASAELATREIIAQSQGRGTSSSSDFVSALAAAWPDLAARDLALAVKMLQLPSLVYLADQVDEFDAAALHAARENLLKASYAALAAPLATILARGDMLKTFVYNARAMSERAAAALALDALAYADREAAARVALRWLHEAPHMAAEQAALLTLVHHHLPGFEEALSAFYARWHHEALVLDQWFAVQAASPRPDTLEVIRRLLIHSDFQLDVPNRVRSVLAQFANNNPVAFHAAGGEGYRLLGEYVAAIDRANPQLASRLAGAFGIARKLPKRQRDDMAAVVQTLLQEDLSADSRETLSRIHAGLSEQAV